MPSEKPHSSCAAHVVYHRAAGTPANGVQRPTNASARQWSAGQRPAGTETTAAGSSARPYGAEGTINSGAACRPLRCSYSVDWPA